MSRPLRDRNPGYYHLVTVRTEEARIWMVPCAKLNGIIGGILARYQTMYQVIIYAFCILGNHLHLLAKAPNDNLDQFMENVLREISRRVNRHNQRRGHLWARRYDDQVILNEDDLLEAYLYVVTNAVKHGLARRVRVWPGLHCYKQILSETPQTFCFVQYSKQDSRGRPVVTLHDLSLTPLPQHAGRAKKVRLKLVAELIEERESQIADERRQNNQGFLDPRCIASQKPGRKPLTVSYRTRPVCYTKDPCIRREYRADRRLFKQAYCEASEAFRNGAFRIKFPPYCFKPPLHRNSRSLCLEKVYRRN